MDDVISTSPDAIELQATFGAEFIINDDLQQSGSLLTSSGDKIDVTFDSVTPAIYISVARGGVENFRFHVEGSFNAFIDKISNKLIILIPSKRLQIELDVAAQPAINIYEVLQIN